MKINKDEFRKLLSNKKMGFARVNGVSEEVWQKVYTKHDGYTITINFDKDKIDYISGATSKQGIVMRGKNPDGTPVKATRKTTSNFAQAENMVVLECVNRLLEKGYKPNDIILEKSWTTGHGSDYLDIYVTNKGEAYLMIECKTFGKSYANEKKKMQKLKNDGQPDGQLWSYADREKSKVKLLCLYSSCVNNENEIEYINDIIEFQDEWRDKNSREQFDLWINNTHGGDFKNAGIFETQYDVYNTKCTQVRELKKLTAESASSLFQDFLEVLRHHAISDKANAYNKILNIFMCKIIDEDEIPEKRKFWWDEDTDANEFMSILEDLYKRGMDSFLGIKITDYSDEEIDSLLPITLSAAERNIIKEAFIRQKTERSSEFAFREIYNEQTFNENAAIVREVVKLIQGYQFRYGHKHQFLGEFFEDLLETSIKQESGQFFTPIRIARFICSSLPIREETMNCLKDTSNYYLPLMIDYACGSGHFLTEYMDIEQAIINEIDRSKYNRAVRRELGDKNQHDTDYVWASKYVYGIEKDYRLAKTTKLNTFLNGDGDANIVNADGLAPFNSFDTSSALYSTSSDNRRFTFLVANPPYSVEDFAKVMDVSSPNIFQIWQSNMGDNIECLFVERAAQLLKDGGYAGIILPDSLSFTNEDLFSNTRKLIFEKFRIKSVVNMTGKCFAKTSVNTKILFLKRRPDRDATDARNLVDGFFKNFRDFTFEGTGNVVHTYLKNYGENLKFDVYVKFLKQGKVNAENRYLSRMSDVINDAVESALAILRKDKIYVKLSAKKQIMMEKQLIKKVTMETIVINEWQKLYYYLLTFKDRVVIADTLDKEEGKTFTGLQFSERSGKKGTKNKDANGLINDDDIWGDKNKLNYYIHLSCLGLERKIPKCLEKHARWANASEMFDYYGEFRNEFQADIKKKIIKPLQEGYIEKRVGIILDSIGGDSKYTSEYIAKHKGAYPVFSAATIGEAVKGYVDSYDYDMEGIQITTNGEYSGTTRYHEKTKFCVAADNRFYFLRKDFASSIEIKYIYHQLKNLVENGGYSWARKSGDEEIRNQYLQIPVDASGIFDLKKQRKIAQELDAIDARILQIKQKVDKCNDEISECFIEMFGNPLKNNRWETTHLNKQNLKNGLNYTYSDDGNTVKCLTVADFRNNFRVDVKHIKEISIAEDFTEDYYLRDGDIVFVRSNGNKKLVGRCVLIQKSEDEASIFSGFCIKYSNKDDSISNIFLVSLLKLPEMREMIFGRGSNITNLNQTMLSDIDIIKPPLDLQKKFEEKVNIINAKQNKMIMQIEKLVADKMAAINMYF